VAVERGGSDARVDAAGSRGDGASLLTGIADGSTVSRRVGPVTGPRPTADGGVLRGEISALPDAAVPPGRADIGRDGDSTGLFAIDAASAGVSVAEQTHVDPTRKLFNVTFDDVPAQPLASPSAEDISGLVVRRC